MINISNVLKMVNCKTRTKIERIKRIKWMKSEWIKQIKINDINE